MSNLDLQVKDLESSISIPGDKSVTHRSVMFASLASGESLVRTSCLGRDNFATIRIFQQMGVDISLSLSPTMYEIAVSEGIQNINKIENPVCTIQIKSNGPSHFSESENPLDCGNSGTTGRLLCGILASLEGRSFTLSGDESLSTRPFKRVTEPLGSMGASFDRDMLPLKVHGAQLSGKSFTLPKPSAQVKSAILLGGLFADGGTSVREKVCSRDHTERMLQEMGVSLDVSHTEDMYEVSVLGDRNRTLSPISMSIPGDISAAMFFIVAAACSKNSSHDSVTIQGMGINPTRIGPLETASRMGLKYEMVNIREEGGEPVADIIVPCGQQLRGIEIDAVDVAKGVDEIPILSVAAAFAEGETTIRGAGELRVKESDRLAMTAAILTAYGADVEEYEDGLSIKGGSLKPREILGETSFKACHDHRISMCAAVLEYLLFDRMIVSDLASIETSFPNFFDNFTRK